MERHDVTRHRLLSLMDNVVALVFAKYPTPGAVKTRMVPPLSAEDAAALHRACLVTVCHKLTRVDRITTRLVVTPDDRAADLHALIAGTLKRFRLSSNEPRGLARADAPVPRRGRQVENPNTKTESALKEAWPQGDGDLGRRLQRASSRAFNGGADAVLLFGADSPTFPLQVVYDALDALTCHDVAIGPSYDGGYYLLGLARPSAAVFERIDWGGSEVAEQTLDRALTAGLSIRELTPWYDLDRFADLEPTARDLAKLTDTAPQAMMTLGRLIDQIRRRVGQ